MAVAGSGCKVHFPAGAQPIPSSFNVHVVPGLPATCVGQTYFEASTALCSTGITWLLCDGWSFTEFDCANPGKGWSLAPLVSDPVATGLNECPMSGSSSAPSGSVYVEDNRTAPDENAVLQFRYCGGALLQTVVGRFTTGGSGARDHADEGILDADQQIAVSADQTLLYTVNQGSDSIAAFDAAGNGVLTPLAGSPFASGGSAPASVGLAGNVLVVANKSSDGVRSLGGQVPNYTTFSIGNAGALTPTGSTYELPMGASPTQVHVVPEQGLVFTTEESGVLRSLQVSPTGTLSLAPGSPLALPDSLFASGKRPNPVWPAGLSTAIGGSILYTGIPNAGSIATYAFTATGQLTLIAGVAEPGGSLPCWSVVSHDGRRLYFANAGSDNISVWDTSADPGHPTLKQNFALPGGGNPWGLTIDPTGTLLFVITPRQVVQVPAGQGQLLHGLRIASDGTLTEMAGSPVSVPVEFDDNLLGVAVVADR
jgi:DNA-binding beta-propeller fold protein YncE